MGEMVTEPITVADMAAALLNRNELRLRLLVQIWQRTPPVFATIPRPSTDDPRLLAAAAALVELLAQHARELPPTWTATAGALPEPFFVMRRAERPGFSRNLSLAESPEPFKRHNIFAPPNFLQLV